MSLLNWRGDERGPRRIQRDETRILAMMDVYGTTPTSKRGAFFMSSNSW